MKTEEELQEWKDSAPFWDKHSGTIRSMFAPVTVALIEEAKITTGQRVLDVAGGPGEPSLTIAEVVGPSGSVICTDPVGEMVAAAERESHRRGLTNVSFRQCVADSLPFEDNSFDAVVCRLGAMFFPDPLAALREMLRVAKAKARIAMVVWSASEENPFSYLVTNAVSRYTEKLPAEPAHDAFCFAEPGKLASILQAAGATEIRERPFEFHIEAPLTPEQFWRLRSEISGTLRDKLSMLSNDERQSVAQDVQVAVAPFFPNNQMSFPARMLIVSGEKP